MVLAAMSTSAASTAGCQVGQVCTDGWNQEDTWNQVAVGFSQSVAMLLRRKPACSNVWGFA
jgi:hypothetical protein